MDLASDILKVIDLRSFSSVWYWMVLAVVWSSASYFVLGVPFDLIQRARRKGGQDQQDLYDVLRVNVTRILTLSAESGAWALGGASFVLTILLVLAVWYQIELAQSIVLIAIPLALVGLLSLLTARRLFATSPEGEALYRVLHRHRFHDVNLAGQQSRDAG